MPNNYNPALGPGPMLGPSPTMGPGPAYQQQRGFRALPQAPEQDRMTKLLRLFQSLYSQQPDRQQQLGSY